MTITIIAGGDLYAALQAEKAARVQRKPRGFDSEQLCRLQESQAGRGILGAQIVLSNYGYSVRYDSGLQGWAILRPARGQADASHEAAVAFCHAWVAGNPASRYAWE